MNSSRLQSALDFIIVPWGIWTLYVQVLVYTRRDFNDLIGFAPLTLAVGLALAAWLVVRTRADAHLDAEPIEPPAEPHPYAPWVVLAGVAVLWTVGWGAMGSALAVVLAVGSAYWSRKLPPAVRSAPRAASLPVGRGDLFLAMLALAIAAFQVMFLHWHAGDDGFYVGTAVAALDYPQLPLMRFDFYYGWMDPPVQYMVVHRPQSHELTVAFLSTVTGLPVLAVHYIALPAAAVLLWAAANYALARRVFPAHAGLTLLVLCLLLSTWSGLYGNFGLLRMFQGKSVFVSAIVPLIWLNTWRFVCRPTMAGGIVLACTQVVGVGLTSTALVLSPVAAALAALSVVIADPRRWRAVVLAGLTAMPAVWPLALLYLETEGQDLTGVVRGSHGLGTPPRVAVVFSLVAALPLLFHAPRSRMASILGGLGVLTAIYLSPVTSWTFRQFANNLSWRFVWALPAAAFVAFAAVQLARAPLRRRFAWAALCISSVLMIAGGPWPTQRSQKVSLALPGPGVPAELLSTAQRVAELTPAAEVSLTDSALGPVIPMVRGHPIQLVGRKGYVSKKKIGPMITEQDIRERVRLRRFMDDRNRGLAPEDFVEQVINRGIYSIVIRTRHSRASEVVGYLEARGYHRHSAGSYIIVSKTPAEPSGGN